MKSAANHDGCGRVHEAALPDFEVRLPADETVPDRPSCEQLAQMSPGTPPGPTGPEWANPARQARDIDGKFIPAGPPLVRQVVNNTDHGAGGGEQAHVGQQPHKVPN